MFQSIIKSQPNEDISILIQPDNHPWNYLCECGDASGLTVKEIQNTKAIFISHTHIDHFVNFDAVIRHQIGIERRIVVCGPAGIANQIKSRLHSYTWNLIQKGSITYEIREVLDNEVNVFELEPPFWELKQLEPLPEGIIFEEKDFFVTSVILDHKIPVLAYKFEERDTLKIDIGKSGFRGGRWVKKLKSAYENGLENHSIEIEGKEFAAKELFHLLHIKKGDSVGIIMDHAASETNHAKISGHFGSCQTVYIECFYKEEDKNLAQLNSHSYSSMSGKVMAESRVERAVPVHFSRKYKEPQIKELILEFEMAIQKAKKAL